MRETRQRARREMRFQAGHATWADERVVPGAGGQLEPVALSELDGGAVVRQPELDRPVPDGDHLVVAVLVSAVPVARPVRPRGRVKTFRPKSPFDVGRHPAATPMIEPIV